MCTLQKYWLIINSSKHLHDTNVVLGHRRNKNLSYILVKSRIRYPPTRRLNQISGKINNVCVYTSNIKCDYCLKIDTWGKMVWSNTKGKYKGPKDGTCDKNNLVYLVTCQRWHIEHIEQLKRDSMNIFMTANTCQIPTMLLTVCKGRNPLEYQNTSVWNHTMWMMLKYNH